MLYPIFLFLLVILSHSIYPSYTHTHHTHSLRPIGFIPAEAGPALSVGVNPVNPASPVVKSRGGGPGSNEEIPLFRLNSKLVEVIYCKGGDIAIAWTQQLEKVEAIYNTMDIDQYSYSPIQHPLPVCVKSEFVHLMGPPSDVLRLHAAFVEFLGVSKSIADDATMVLPSINCAFVGKVAALLLSFNRQSLPEQVPIFYNVKKGKKEKNREKKSNLGRSVRREGRQENRMSGEETAEEGGARWTNGRLRWEATRHELRGAKGPVKLMLLSPTGQERTVLVIEIHGPIQMKED
eukprot:GHVQ01030130.1.p1 GENE.GHVQ01030130.1~~GHVQ01030130.1.p1  ORF type:complete len:305 (-),score=29.11 GHVQ01030130.1:52-924(-)